MKQIAVLSDARDCFVGVVHNGSDPGVWIIRQGKKYLLFKKCFSLDWFYDQKQAMAFADDIVRERNHSRQNTRV